MKLSEIGDYAGKYFAAADFEGRREKFTIEAVEVATFKDGAEKVALELEGQKRKLVLNKTNARNIQRVVGSDDLDQWVGTVIEVDAIEAQFAGKPVRSLRVVAVDDGVPF